MLNFTDGTGPYCITGSWRYKVPQLRREVAETVKEYSLRRRRKLIVGGAPEVDTIATKVLLNGIRDGDKIEDLLEIHIPSKSLGDFFEHFGNAYEEGIITLEQATQVPAQLYNLYRHHPNAFVYLRDGKEELGKFNYYRRIMNQVNNSEEVRAFWVGESAGVRFAMDYADKKGIPVYLELYNIPQK